MTILPKNFKSGPRSPLRSRCIPTRERARRVWQTRSEVPTRIPYDNLRLFAAIVFEKHRVMAAQALGKNDYATTIGHLLAAEQAARASYGDLLPNCAAVCVLLAALYGQQHNIDAAEGALLRSMNYLRRSPTIDDDLLSQVALRMADLCDSKGHDGEARHLIKQASILKSPQQDKHAQARAKTYLMAGPIHARRKEYFEASDALTDSITRLRELPDKKALAKALRESGYLFMIRLRWELAASPLRESYELFSKIRTPDDPELADLHVALAFCDMMMHAFTSAASHFQQAASIYAQNELEDDAKHWSAFAGIMTLKAKDATAIGDQELSAAAEKYAHQCAEDSGY